MEGSEILLVLTWLPSATEEEERLSKRISMAPGSCLGSEAHRTSVMALTDVCFPKATVNPSKRGLEERMLSSRQRSHRTEMLWVLITKAGEGSAFPLAKHWRLINE